MLTLIFVLVFIAVFLVTLILLGYEPPSRTRVKQALRHTSNYVREEQRTSPATGTKQNQGLALGALDRISRFVGKSSLINNGNLQNKLVKAGIRNIDADKFISIKLMLLGAALLVYVLYFMSYLIKSGQIPWVGLLILLPAYFGPGLWLSRRIERRNRQIQSGLAESLDILTIAIEAGSSFDSALVKVVEHMKGPLGEEFGRMLWELQVGVSRHEAYRNLGARNDVPELNRISNILIQTDTLGISISRMLRTEITEIRKKRKQRIEEAALKTPVKLVFPVILCIIPALLLIIVGPGVIRIAEMFAGN